MSNILSPEEQYKKETGKSIWQIQNHTYTNEYIEWLKNYAKTSNDPAAIAVRDFASKHLKTKP